jgi:HEPN domain-containing protein
MPLLDDGSDAQDWIRSTEEDLVAMRTLLREPTVRRRMVCFTAHLVVEKSLKAMLCSAGVRFANTHNIVLLHSQCSDAGRSPRLDPLDLQYLRSWAIDGRYGDGSMEPDARRTVQLAELAAQALERARELCASPTAAAAGPVPFLQASARSAAATAFVGPGVPPAAGGDRRGGSAAPGVAPTGRRLPGQPGLGARL